MHWPVAVRSAGDPRRNAKPQIELKEMEEQAARTVLVPQIP